MRACVRFLAPKIIRGTSRIRKLEKRLGLKSARVVLGRGTTSAAKEQEIRGWNVLHRFREASTVLTWDVDAPCGHVKITPNDLHVRHLG